ncbi:MAG: heparan-alpha-glucosaminide N-acetyltransferase domain-containing protein [Bryobacteraceae bacterium]
MSTSSRFAAVDALRGLIMIVMAIDHASAFISRQHGSEFWNGAISSYRSAFPFLTRWITHLCAPGFFFLMGAGVYWFVASRRQSGWSEAGIVRRIALRGVAIFLTGQFLETPVLFLAGLQKGPAVSLSRMPQPLPNDGTSLYWGFITLSGLGMVLMLCSLLLLLRPWMWLVICALCVYATNSLLPASGKIGPIWETVLLAPGLSQHLIVLYPVIPWLAVAAFGMYFGYWWKANPAAQKNVWIWGAALVLLAVGLRALGGWGNITQARDSGWIEFLNNVKYPPSLVFWTMSVGLNLLLLALLMRLPEGFRSEESPLIVFGQTPLFFYLAHFYLLAIFGFAFFREAGSPQMAYVMWVVVLALLYPVCAAYRRFKSGKPFESVWRLF